MLAYIRHVGTSEASQQFDNGAVHIEQRCRLSLVPEEGEVPLTPDHAAVIERELARALEMTFTDWLDAHKLVRTESRATHDTSISYVGFGAQEP